MEIVWMEIKNSCKQMIEKETILSIYAISLFHTRIPNFTFDHLIMTLTIQRTHSMYSINRVNDKIKSDTKVVDLDGISTNENLMILLMTDILELSIKNKVR
jgi:hypothetical protein